MGVNLASGRDADTPHPIDLPPVHPVFSAMRLFVQAHIRSVSREEGEAFLQELGQLIADEETIHPLFVRRPVSERGEVMKGQRQAANWIREVMPLLAASLPPKRRK